MSNKNNKKDEEIKDVKAEQAVEEAKAEAPVEEKKAKEVKAETAEVKAEAPVEEKKVEAPVVEKGPEPVDAKAIKNDTKVAPVQNGKKRVNVYAIGMDLAYITYPFTGVKKGIVLDLQDIQRLCWHKVPVEEIKADGTVVKLTLENYDK